MSAATDRSTARTSTFRIVRDGSHNTNATEEVSK